MKVLLDKALQLFSTFSTISVEEKKSEEDSTDQVLMTISEESPSLTDALMNYKEIKWIATKTGIDPKYFLYFFSAVLLIVLINYFSYLITMLIGVVYPIRQSIHELRLGNKDGTRRWMQYWVVFFLFINIETLLGKFLTQMPMYLFYKIVFLLICFLPSYDGADYFYNAFLRPPFKLYERQLYKYTVKFTKKITQKIYCE